MKELLYTDLIFVEDPSHGWLRVPLQEIALLEIQDEISPFSFIDVKEGVAYLEEDCDYGVFARAREKMGVGWTDVRQHTNHFNRNRPRFDNPAFDKDFWQCARAGGFNS